MFYHHLYYRLLFVYLLISILLFTTLVLSFQSSNLPLILQVLIHPWLHFTLISTFLSQWLFIHSQPVMFSLLLLESLELWYVSLTHLVNAHTFISDSHAQSHFGLIFELGLLVNLLSLFLVQESFFLFLSISSQEINSLFSKCPITTWGFQVYRLLF